MDGSSPPFASPGGLGSRRARLARFVDTVRKLNLRDNCGKKVQQLKRISSQSPNRLLKVDGRFESVGPHQCEF